MFKHLLNYHTPLEQELEKAAGLRIEALPLLIRSLHNPDTCPADLLPWLAWALSVDHWSPHWSEAQKRHVCKSSLQIHRHKGTIGAVEDALATLGISLEVIEPKDQDPTTRVPHKLRILATVNSVFLNIESGRSSLLNDIRSIVKHTAPARCSFILELGFEWIEAMMLVVAPTAALKFRSDVASTERLETLVNEGSNEKAATVALTQPLNLRSSTANTKRGDLVRRDNITAPFALALTGATVFKSIFAETAS